MMNQKRTLSLLLAVLVLPAAIASAAVNLAFTLTSPNPVPNGTFTLRLDLAVTAGEQITAVDYFLQELTSAGFRIIARSVTGSAYDDTYFSDAMVSMGNEALLNPRNDFDLGGATQDPNIPSGSGVVANYTIQVPNVAPGNYTISTVSNAGTGWVGPGPGFMDNAFNQHASIVVQVIPEPSTVALLALAGLGVGVAAYRRRAKSA